MRTGEQAGRLPRIPMTQSRPGVLLPLDGGSAPVTPTARYALHALDDLTQITFAALADAVRMYSARGIAVPRVLAASRFGDRSARGLCHAVELALGDLARDDRRVAALAGSFQVSVHDIVDAVRAPQPTVTAVGGDVHAALEREDQFRMLGRSVAMVAALDELRTRMFPA